MRRSDRGVRRHAVLAGHRLHGDPWAAYRLFKGVDLAHGGHEPRRERRRPPLPPRDDALIARPSVRWPFFGAVALVLLLTRPWSSGMVKVKMLPFDNKSEFQS